MKTSKLIGTLLVILISMIAFTGISYAQDSDGGPTDIWIGQVNINSAGVEEVQQIPGMDNELSASIVEFREANGPFSSISDLLKVRGLDEKKLSFIKGYISLEGDTTLEHIYP
jgi:competence ComEA-like helix-hairpin-helix protein